MDRRFQFGEHVVFHLVTAGAEFLGVGDFECGIEAAPEDDAGDEACQHQHAQAEDRTGADQDVPEIDDKGADLRDFCRLRFARDAHRRPPGVALLSIVSMSMKSLVTAALRCAAGRDIRCSRTGAATRSRGTGRRGP